MSLESAKGFKLTLLWNVFILQGDASLLSVVEDGARRGLKECQRLFQSKPWNCPVEMYKKLPLFDHKTLPSSKSAVLTFCSVSNV